MSAFKVLFLSPLIIFKSDPYCIAKLYEDNREEVVAQSQTHTVKKVFYILVRWFSVS